MLGNKRVRAWASTTVRRTAAAAHALLETALAHALGGPVAVDPLLACPCQRGLGAVDVCSAVDGLNRVDKSNDGVAARS